MNFFVIVFLAMSFFILVGIQRVIHIIYPQTERHPSNSPTESPEEREPSTNKTLYDPSYHPAPARTVPDTSDTQPQRTQAPMAKSLEVRMPEACDFEKTRPLVLPAIQPDHAGPYQLAQICDLYDYLYKRWKYVSDPLHQEYVEWASTTWNGEFSGDCDDWTVAMASAVRAIGGDVHLVIAQGPSGSHAYTEVTVDKKDLYNIRKYLRERYGAERNINVFFADYPNGKTYLNLDYRVPHPGGKYFLAESTTVIDLLDKETNRYRFDLNP